VFALFLQPFYKIYDSLLRFEDIYTAEAYSYACPRKEQELYSSRKGEIMKANILRRALSIFSILVLFAALVVSTGYARARGSAMFQVPFDFVVAGKSLPAGKYVIERSTLFSAVGLSLRNVDRDEGVFVLTTSVQANEIQNDSKLIFNHYQDQYFLSEFWTSGEASGRKLIESAQERALGREVAKNRTMVERVAIDITQK